jgi:hypothetical protein
LLSGLNRSLDLPQHTILLREITSNIETINSLIHQPLRALELDNHQREPHLTPSQPVERQFQLSAIDYSLRQYGMDTWIHGYKRAPKKKPPIGGFQNRNIT